MKNTNPYGSGRFAIFTVPGLLVSFFMFKRFGLPANRIAIYEVILLALAFCCWRYMKIRYEDEKQIPEEDHKALQQRRMLGGIAIFIGLLINNSGRNLQHLGLAGIFIVGGLILFWKRK